MQLNVLMKSIINAPGRGVVLLICQGCQWFMEKNGGAAEEIGHKSSKYYLRIKVLK